MLKVESQFIFNCFLVNNMGLNDNMEKKTEIK